MNGPTRIELSLEQDGVRVIGALPRNHMSSIYAQSQCLSPAEARHIAVLLARLADEVERPL